MNIFLRAIFVVMFVGAGVIRAQGDFAAVLPAGVEAAWDLGRAAREATPTREKLCINGLWRWQPATIGAERVPESAWGFFKVPGSWPGITDYMQKDAQTVVSHPSWRDTRLRDLSAAWYQREISIPAEWTGRRIALSARYVNSLAVVWLDGVKLGEIRFPGGELELTTAVRPGATHTLSVLVTALPLQAVLLSYADTNTAKEVRGRVARRGLCGDLFLESTPVGARVADVKVSPSFRQRQLAVEVALDGLAVERRYAIEARVSRAGQMMRTFRSREFSSADLVAGRFTFSEAWIPDALWDTYTPQNQCELACTLVETGGRAADAAFVTRFGFREFWIEGRDFYLNGTPLHLRAVPLDNAEVSAALASYAGARESLERLKAIGVNFVYTHNYGCEPGSHLSFDEVLRAADDVGMLVAFSQPHFSHYDWKAPDADRTNGYARHAEFYVRAAQNHPCVVAYAMNHNSTGYTEDMNPDLIDGRADPRERNAQAQARLALRAEAIVRGLDGSRVTYHHSSGNLGAMHTINFYPNFAPIQELSDWFGHWATEGVKPLFLCEYGAPFTWDWTMYRGWYRGVREFGSAAVPWEFCLAEWNAQFVGDRAFQISAREAANLRWEARQFADGKVWHRWDYPNQVGASDFDERFPIIARYIADNWPAYRTWGVSAISPWEYGHYWKPRPGVDRRRQELPVDWAHLQKPGLSADFIGERYERMDLAFGRDDWIATPAAETLLRYNRPLLAWIAGKRAAFTSKDHVFTPGETVEKQLIVLNDSRESVECEASWSFEPAQPMASQRKFRVAPGERESVSLRYVLPAKLSPGDYTLHASVRFGGGEVQRDAFRVTVVPAAPAAAQASGRVALFDPRGETAALLRSMGVAFQAVDAAADLAAFDLLVVGKAALTPGGAAPDLARVRDGLKVIVFEQTAAALEQRLGFRVAEYGLREVFRRVPDHPALVGIDEPQLRDWRGEATLLAPRLTYETRPRYGPTVKWCDLPVTRLWRCGNRGNVASVLIEKPARGNFLPLVDGGYGLQYSPLLEFREGRGLVVFCQLDVTARTEADPVAARLTRNLLDYVATWQPAPARHALYAGDPAGKAHFAAAGVALADYAGGRIAADDVLILGPGAGRGAASDKNALGDFLRAGGRALAVGLDQADADAVLPLRIGLASQEHIATLFEPPGRTAPLAGVSPADVHNRDPRKLPLVASGATAVGDGVLATANDGRVVFLQLAPWQFDPAKQSNLKRTFRRAAFTATRVLTNLGVESTTPLLERFHTPVATAPAVSTSNPPAEPRWAHGLYLDTPEEWDDPYRFFRW